MTNWGDYLLREFGGAALRGARQGASEQVARAFAEGFDAAANTSLNVLTGRIDALLGEIHSGRSLSEKEQLLLSTLIEVRSETEKDLRDWTPPKPDKAR